jgi:hypothetical protein
MDNQQLAIGRRRPAQRMRGTFAACDTLNTRSTAREGRRRRAAMAQIISKCPLTGHYMFIGIDVDEERFARFPDVFARAFCPYCACEHGWRKRDSRLAVRQPAMRRGVQQAS